MSETDKSVWTSGEICNLPAVYFANTCGHPIRKDYRKHDIFIRCPTCHQPLRWTRASPSAATGPDSPQKYA